MAAAAAAAAGEGGGGLQRSQISFRRQGSSGSVWDDKFLNELQKQAGEPHNNNISSDITNPKSQIGGGRGEGGGGHQRSSAASEVGPDGGDRTREVYRTVKVIDSEDPPSPKVSACGFCGVFGKKSPAPKNNSNARGRPS